jgi:hypothetical protein
LIGAGAQGEPAARAAAAPSGGPSRTKWGSATAPPAWRATCSPRWVGGPGGGGPSRHAPPPARTPAATHVAPSGPGAPQSSR